MYCSSCGEEMNENQEICLKCGIKKGKGKNYCPNCGKAVQAGAAVCLNCGVAVANQGGNLAGKDKITIAVVCFFLGGLGIHNFMMGEKKKGIFRLIMCLFCGIGYIFALIDLVKILMDKYEVNPDALI